MELKQLGTDCPNPHFEELFIVSLIDLRSSRYFDGLCFVFTATMPLSNC